MRYIVSVPVQVYRGFDPSDEGEADYNPSDDVLTLNIEGATSKWDAIFKVQEALSKLASK